MLTGRCYCGATTLGAATAPSVVAFCHCADCRRWTGAPLPDFAAFADGTLTIEPDPGPFSTVPGVERWFCRTCGSPLAARFDYLPGQVYVPLGVLDQAPDLAPALHAHADAALPWLHIADDLPRQDGSAQEALGPGGGDAP
ncbi:MAG: GFA family protein [Pseudomonadota bacterium]